ITCQAKQMSPNPSTMRSVRNRIPHADVGGRIILRMSWLTFEYVSFATVSSSGRRSAAAHLLQVGHRRAGIAVAENLVTALALHELHDPALRILQVDEPDRLRRAGLLAGRHDAAVTDVAVLVLRRVLRQADALDAEGALLHHALVAHGDVGIELPVE